MLAVVVQTESISFPFVRLRPETVYFRGWDGSDGAGIRTLARSKNRREDFERQGWVLSPPGSQIAAESASEVAMIVTSS